MRRKTTRKRSIRPQGGLANPLKIGYTSPCGAEFFRCVGGCFTCAGHRELALPVTAVVLFSIAIISYWGQYSIGKVHKYWVHYMCNLYIEPSIAFRLK